MTMLFKGGYDTDTTDVSLPCFIYYFTIFILPVLIIIYMCITKFFEFLIYICFNCLYVIVSIISVYNHSVNMVCFLSSAC